MSTTLWSINWKHMCQKKVFFNSQKYGRNNKQKELANG